MMLFLALSTGLVAFLLTLFLLQPRINKQIAVGGYTFSELMSGDTRDMKLSALVMILAVLKMIFYFAIYNVFIGGIFLNISVVILLLGTMALIMTDILSLDRSEFWHDIFAKSYVGLQVVGSIFLGMSQLFETDELISKLVGLGTIFAAGILVRQFRQVIKDVNFPIKGVRLHMYFLYFFIFLNLLLLLTIYLT